MDMRSRLLTAASAVVLTTGIAAAAAALSPADSTKLFLDRCSSCHSVGGGDLAGPDLIVAAKLPPDALRASVKKMEDNAGELTHDEIDGLVALLKDPHARERIAGTFTSAPPPVQLGDAKNGRRLFFGEKRFQNGGSACFACHTAGGTGGNLAADLTAAQARLGDAGITAAAERPGFPMMKGAYGTHAVTHSEAIDIDAFLRDTAARAPRGAPPLPERTAMVHGTAGAVAAAVFTVVGVAFRSRRTSRQRNGGRA